MTDQEIRIEALYVANQGMERLSVSTLVARAAALERYIKTGERPVR